MPAGLRLLVVEDNPASRLVARILLEKMGYVVDLAASGEEGLQKIVQQRYDAVLMDCQMPVLDGYAVTRRLRSGAVAGADPKLPVIALTAYAMADDRRKCLAAGMNDYVSKPIGLVELRAAFVRCGLERPEAGPQPPGTEPPREMEPEIIRLRTVEMMRAFPGRRGPSLWPEMLELFRREEPKWLGEIDRLTAARSGDGIVSAAHTLAGTCASIGAVQMREVVLAVERAARTGDWPGVEARFGELKTASGRLHAALEALNLPPT